MKFGKLIIIIKNNIYFHFLETDIIYWFPNKKTFPWHYYLLYLSMGSMNNTMWKINLPIFRKIIDVGIKIYEYFCIIL